VLNAHLPAIEYKTYFDIRFDPHLNIQSIISSLENCVGTTKSCRACCTLGEFCAAQPDIDGNKERACMYYAQAAEQGDVVGNHWMGIYYMEGFGVKKDLNKAEAHLLKAHKAGNGQSSFQLFLLFSNTIKKDVKKAYLFLHKAVQLGVNYFEQMTKYFKDNYDVLAPVYSEIKKHEAGLTRAQVENLHEADLKELQESF
jgi:TPR repeat protein